MSRRSEKIDALFDFVIDHPEGVTVSQMRAALGMREIKGVIRGLRLVLASEDRNLTATPAGPNQEWLYTIDAQSEAWAANRVGDAESRLETMTAMMQSVVRATDGRTMVGRKSRKMEVTFRHLQEDLGLLTVES